ncbi:MAG: lipoprotein [Halothiobacillaceae bacterium]|nr:MAG: lipoprotein [Halothiobacillaceae bacterium]
MRSSLTVGVLFMVLLVSACGQKGDLYLPDKAAQKPGMAETAAR